VSRSAAARYLVTGGTGFIGGEVVRQLRVAGHRVVALVRDPSRAARLRALGAELAVGDVTDRGSLLAPMRGVDGVFHLAAWYRVGAPAEEAEAINVGGTLNVLEAMRDLGVPKGVYTSSLVVHGDTGGRVVGEGYRATGPHLSAYAETKSRAHHEVALRMIAEGLPLVVTMPGVVYGPGDTSQLGGLLRDAAAGRRVLIPGGASGVCWGHVEDTARGHLLAMERGSVGASYIVAGPPHSYREAFTAAAGAAGTRLRAIALPPPLLRFGALLMAAAGRVVPVPADLSAEAMRVTAGTTYYGDSTRAVRELDFRARSLEEGMRDTFGAAGGG
jgi:dihydroflavonol-4-reductase